GNSAHGSGTSHGSGYLGIAASFATRNLAQSVPHDLLEGSPLNVERNLSRIEATAQKSAYLVRKRSQSIVIADQLGSAEFAAQVFLKLGIMVAETHRTQTAVGSCNQHLAEIGGDDRVADFRAGAFEAESRGRHAQLGGDIFIRAAAGAVTG